MLAPKVISSSGWVNVGEVESIILRIAVLLSESFLGIFYGLDSKL